MKTFLFLILFIFSFEGKGKTDGENFWSWTLDQIFYSLRLEPKNFVFQSDQAKVHIKINSCSEKLVRQFRRELQKKIETYNDKIDFPKSYEPIEIQSPRIGSFQVARGTELGLFLIDMKFQIQKLQGKVALLCKP